MENIINLLKGKQEVLLLHKDQLMFEYSRAESDINETNKQLDRLKSQIDFLSKNPDTDLSSYFTKEEYDEYVAEPCMLYEEGEEVFHWIDWFYSELPIILNKYLIFTGANTGKDYSITQLYGVVKTNHKLKRIEVHMDEPVVISLISCNLYDMLKI